MATTNNLTTTYAGEFAGKYISAALLSGKTLAAGNITVVPNVKFKQVMKKVSTNAIVKDASCDFDPTSTLTLTERILQPEEFQVNLQLCKADFRSDWEAVQMGFSAYDNLPPQFSDFLIAHVADKVAQKMEQNIWNGTNANAGEFDGFKTTLLADADVVDVAGQASTSSNVAAEIGKVMDAIPSAVYGAEDLVIYVPSNILRNYIRSLGGFGANGLGAAGTNNEGNQWYNMGNAVSFDGVELVHAPGLASDTMVAAERGNLFFGTGLLSDQNEVKVIDMADIDGSQNVRVIMRFTAGIQHGIGSDIVLYS
ncbi:MAG: hypothetical protein CMI74_05655 [Candidatus Pelagibacter sp.]|nr:hypothetical protein [Candidatus Pelagibacter sp.]